MKNDFCFLKEKNNYDSLEIGREEMRIIMEILWIFEGDFWGE